MLFLRVRSYGARLPRTGMGACLYACLLAVAFLLVFTQTLYAASCCGGSGGSSGPSSILGPLFKGRLDLSFDWEKYDGYWNENSDIQEDPPDSDLNQYRLNLGYARRFSYSWQGYLTLPYVWNDNRYAGETTGGQGLGDMTFGVWWQTSREWLYLGPSLLIPTGKSPYDNVESSFDVTGRGFYRLNANVLIEKTFGQWDVSASASYGLALERNVNREYGRYVQPYDKQLGDVYSLGGSIAHTWDVSYGSWTGTGGLSYLKEKKASIDGRQDPTSGFQKSSGTATVAYSTEDQIWTANASWNHGLAGQNFPRTDIYSVGVSYGYY